MSQTKPRPEGAVLTEAQRQITTGHLLNATEIRFIHILHSHSQPLLIDWASHTVASQFPLAFPTRTDGSPPTWISREILRIKVDWNLLRIYSVRIFLRGLLAIVGTIFGHRKCTKFCFPSSDEFSTATSSLTISKFHLSCTRRLSSTQLSMSSLPTTTSDREIANNTRLKNEQDHVIVLDDQEDNTSLEMF